MAKAVATESGFGFFSISPSSLTSKWVGESEKLMRNLFLLAKKSQPCVIFFDEIDSILSSRKENEHEASRRLKTEFLTQLDGALSDSDDKILVMGATNLPWGLDEAVLRRMPKRIYVPLPEGETREALVRQMMRKHSGEREREREASSHSASSSSSGVFQLSEKDIQEIVKRTEGFSGSDLTAVSFFLKVFY